MADYITYEIQDSAGRTYIVTTDMMDEENLWYRGNTNLQLSVDGTQHIDRNQLISNSSLISYPAPGGGATTYATIVSVRAIGTTSGVETGWYTYALLALLVVLAVFTLFRKGRRQKSWKNY